MSNLKLKNINFTVNTNESVDGFVTKRTKSDLVTRDHKYDIDTKQLSINNNEDISFINAVDIDWNNAEIPGENLVISNTGDLISRLANTYTKPILEESFSDINEQIYNNSRTTQEAIASLTDTVQNLPTFDDLDNKQNNLVSGENIKTINGKSILGEGDITVISQQSQADWEETDNTESSYIWNKPTPCHFLFGEDYGLNKEEVTEYVNAGKQIFLSNVSEGDNIPFSYEQNGLLYWEIGTIEDDGSETLITYVYDQDGYPNPGWDGVSADMKFYWYDTVSETYRFPVNYYAYQIDGQLPRNAGLQQEATQYWYSIDTTEMNWDKNETRLDLKITLNNESIQLLTKEMVPTIVGDFENDLNNAYLEWDISNVIATGIREFTTVTYRHFQGNDWKLEINGKHFGTGEQEPLWTRYETTLSPTSRDNYEIIDINAKLRVDVNTDGLTTVADITALSNKINNINNAQGTVPADDINNDSQITVADITSLSNFIALDKLDNLLLYFESNPFTIIDEIYNNTVYPKIPILRLNFPGNQHYSMTIQKVVSNTSNTSNTAKYYGECLWNVAVPSQGSGREFSKYVYKLYVSIQEEDIMGIITHIATREQLLKKQDKLVSGTNIKTINGESILGGGDINIDTVLSENYSPSTETENNLSLSSGDTYEEAFSKLEKTINDLKERIAMLENNN